MTSSRSGVTCRGWGRSGDTWREGAGQGLPVWDGAGQESPDGKEVRSWITWSWGHFRGGSIGQGSSEIQVRSSGHLEGVGR